MKKNIVMCVAAMLLFAGVTSPLPAVVQAVDTENTQLTQSPTTQTDESVDSTMQSEETVTQTTETVKEEVKQSETSPSSEEQTQESTTEEKSFTLTFTTDSNHLFESGDEVKELTVKENEKISSSDIPSLSAEQSFSGWEMDGKLYTNEELSQVTVTKDLQLKAIFKQQAIRALISTDASIKDTIATADKTKVLVVPSPTDATQPYQTYAASDAGVKTALNDLYQAGNMQDYVMYVGANVTLTAGTVANTIPSTVDATNSTFASLKDKVNNLVITGHSDDPITQDLTVPSGAKTLAFTANAYFGSTITLRNINYTGTYFYMNGHSLNLNGGSVGNGISIYGGANSGDVVGNPVITVNTTGSGTWNIFGGNQNGGTLKGNTSIIINNTNSGIATLAGGANIGTVDGNVSTVINNAGGRITNLYGGGNGTSTTNTANVTGNVSTNIAIKNSGTAFQLSTYYGGVIYGDIGGKVTNNISGYGRWYGNGERFIGGSSRGNIGTNRSTDGIETNLDSSSYSAGRAEFEGGNRYSGTVTGNITNTIKAGTSSAGGINDFNGGAGNNVEKFNKSGIGASNEATYDAYTPDQRANLAKAAATFKVFGNITSKLVSGSFNNSSIYSTAAGRGGYIEGNTTIEVGTANADGSAGGDGLAYSGSRPTSFDYSTTNKSRGNNSGWDIVGGGGYPATNNTWDIYIKGDTKTVLNNTIARWTYGGSYSGVIEGNSSNTLNGGITDTLEGTGYNGARVYGNGQTTVYNGQVDWFLSGGGWNDAKDIGNVGVTVYEGVINASMGASYGASGDHTITGNSDNRIYGGNFSGTPRTGSNGFSGGITNSGTLLGNASLLIDLRNYDGEFKLPGNTYITGGRPYGQNTTLGTNTDNTITLNIFTKPGVDSLNGASIYGDGGTNATYTKNGSIKMNIQADGSSIGNLYATQYSNISSGKILRNVTANVQGAASINGLSGGSASDNFTNTIASASTNKVVFNFGENVDGTGKYQTDPLNLTGLGIVNFTELNVTNGLKLMANGGNIKNGLSATAANHATTYHSFGDIHLSKNAGIGVSNSSNLVSAAKLTIEDEATLETIPGTGKVNISDIEFPDPAKDELVWIKPTTGDSATQVDSTGTWFGANKAYQVLTINPTIANATKLTPLNFRGTEKATGKSFIGDNDVSKTGSGYGIAIPGSIIDYEVENPGIAQGEGSIFHNVSEVKEGNAPLVLNAWGTETAGTKVQKGRLLIPSGKGITPKLSFEPETQATGSWLYQAEITSSKNGEAPTTIGEQKDSSTIDWQSPDSEYSYEVKVKYSNEAELSARNVIISEKEAADLVDEQSILSLMEAKGRPFFTDSITADVMDEIKQPLATDEVSRKHVIDYKVGTTGNEKEQQANLIVVKNEAEISSDRYFAVYAKDVRMSLADANALSAQQDLAQRTMAQVILADGSANQVPTLADATFSAIKNTTEAEVLKNVSTTYSYQLNGITAEKTVNVAITGTLELKEVPKTMNFETQKVKSTTQTYWPLIEGDLIVKDTRGSERDNWQLTVTEKQPLTSGNTQLSNALSFTDGTTNTVLGPNAVIVEEKTLTTNGEYLVNQEWDQAKNKGLKLTVPPEKQKVGSYQGTLSWSLVSAPGNP
ncbi:MULTISPECIES: hypothetical protein [unclassified Enterococcus]|uniref:hypothetical protein n=1 Tax=unclassified Enterococcus TaxID=2608891 RepID=UPI001A9C13B5|nr:hypothetical protein [Enterococcus sp. DIV1271a]MBO1300250.1 hypothetical protein [Enterococcus sp. DIV1271a]